MSPMADGADLASPAESAAPAAAHLQDGEVIILALRPSGWFVLLTAWPVLAAAVLVALAGWAAGVFFPRAVPRQTLLWVCLLIGALRLLAGCLQWASRLYVLTNRRALRIRGGPRAEMVEVALKNVVQTHVSVSRLERVFGIATLVFEVADPPGPGASWAHIAGAGEVKQIVDEAVRRARGA